VNAAHDLANVLSDDVSKNTARGIMENVILYAEYVLDGHVIKF
jgi:hypothetical protein